MPLFTSTDIWHQVKRERRPFHQKSVGGWRKHEVQWMFSALVAAVLAHVSVCVCVCVCVCVYVSFISTGCVYREYDRWTGDAHIKRRRCLFETSDLCLLRHDSCRYKVWAGVRVGQKVPPCVWGECDFHVNWLRVSQIWLMHWRLNDDFDINQRRRHLTRNIRMGVCVCVWNVVPKTCMLNSWRPFLLITTV